jgi:glycosyltransferase involved in cell wall biosynthesis
LNDKIIAVADAAAKNLTDMGVEREMIKVIINGVAGIEHYDAERKKLTRRELCVPEDAFVCGICARLEECKGIDTLLRAAQRILLKDKNCFFMILGSGSCESTLRELADLLGISDRVKFYGFISDITPYVNCFDLMINCSRGTETSSLALSEGMSISLPCVVSDWGGNPYMVCDGENGLVFRTDNFVELASEIEYMKNNVEEYKRMSQNAYSRYCSELNAKNMARKTEELYSSLFLAKNQKYNDTDIMQSRLN